MLHFLRAKISFNPYRKKTNIMTFRIIIFFIISILPQHSLLSQEHVSVHESQKKFYDSLGFSTTKEYDEYNGFKLIQQNTAKANCTLNKIVFGWHPYWVGSAYLNYQWQYLSDLSFFSYEVDAATGDPVTTHGWETSAVIDSAQANGVRVNLCVTLFSNHSTFFASSTAMQNLIDNLIYLVQLRNANGVNIDFEGVSSSLSPDLTAFMIDLCNQMHAAIPGSQVSICTYAVDWSNLFDLPALDPYIDFYTIMGYGYYYSGSSTAGPTAQLYKMSTFNYTLARTITYYLSNGASKNKLVLGLPYYGHEWNTTSSTVPSSTTGSVGARTYKYIKDNTSGNYSNRLWETNSFTPYYVYNVGNWRQCFIDDELSMAYKYDLVNQRDIAGIGIWALGYDDTYTEMWDLLREKFTDCGTVPCTDTIYDMGGPAGNHFDNESFSYTIAPTNATGLSLTFNSFSLESGYDSLWIYDGYNTNAPLIGGYSGTTSPGTINASGAALTLEFYSDGATTETGWQAVWQCSTDNIIPQTNITTNNWETTNFTATFSDTDNVAIDKKFYQVLDNNGTEWRGNGQNGFINDNFDNSIHPEWTNIAGTWNINSGSLNQTDETLSNTNLYIDVKQDSGNIYVYHWQMNITGSGTNRRAGLHFFCDSADQSNRNNSYMVYFRVDNNKVQLYKYENNVMYLKTDDDLNVDLATWYDYKVIFNTNTGEIKAYRDNILVSEWTDPAPYKHGNSLSLRTGNCNVLYDNIKIYKSRTNTETISIGTTTDDVRYQNASPLLPSCLINSLVTDVSGNFSAVTQHNVNIDWTSPEDISVVNDGIAADIDTTSSNTQLSANWTQSVDTNSGIVNYWYAIGTTPGNTNIVNWTNNGNSTNTTHTGLSLNYGTTYYFTVKCENGAGLFSNITSSDGIFVKAPTSAPVAGFLMSDTTVCSGNSISFYSTSTNAVDYLWNFSGGTPSVSNLENPVVTFDSTGSFSATLVVSNGYGSDTAIFSNISVIQTPVADFSANPLTGTPPLIVLFNNTSTGATSFLWYFGDGTQSTDVNPYHIYNDTALYSITLIAANDNCVDTIVYQDYIEVGNTLNNQYIEATTPVIYPNPTTGRIVLQANDIIDIKIIDLHGNIISGLKPETGKQTLVLDISKFDKGLYLLKLTTNKKAYIEKIILE